MNRMTRKAVIGELRELKYSFERRYDKYPTCLEEAIDYIYQTPQWIPVSERLPEDVLCVTLVTDGINVWSETWEGIRGKWKYNHSAITAWMPLPEPYREEVSD